MITLFGPPWNAPVDVGAEHIETPIGNECIVCGKYIVEGDSGIVLPFVHSKNLVTIAIYHRRCFLENVGVPDFDCKTPRTS